MYPCPWALLVFVQRSPSVRIVAYHQLLVHFCFFLEFFRVVKREEMRSQWHSPTQIFFPCLVTVVFNPLWGHCQEYKIEKKAVQEERLLSEKRSVFAHYNLTLSESFCLTDHEKQVQKFVAHWKVCQKSSQREVIRKNAHKAPKPQRVLLPALLLKFSRSLTNFQASPGKQSSLRSKDRPPNHVSSRSQLESSAGKPFTSSSANQTPRQELRTTPL